MLLPEGRRKEIGAVVCQHAQSVLELTPQELSVGLARGPEPAAERKIELSFFAAASEDIRQRLRPIQEAGFIIEGVSTPCGALWALARLRRHAVPGEVLAYVALGASASALAIVSNGLLLYAREMGWGYAEAPVGRPAPRSREDLASRLAGELRHSFLYVKQFWEGDVSQLLLCGDMPEIRSLTAPLIERLNIEVETLDSLDGIDTGVLPEPVVQFVDQVPSMRLASAVAAEPPPVNLLPLKVVATRASRVGRILLTLGTAAAIAFAAFLHEAAVVRTAAAARQAADLQGQLARVQAATSEVRAESVAESSRREALDAVDTQGPHVARILETMANSTPSTVTVRAIRVIPERSQWRVSVRSVNEAGVESTADYSVPR